MINKFDPYNYLKAEVETEELTEMEAEDQNSMYLLEQRGFTVNDRGKLVLNSNKFVDYLFTRMDALNSKEKCYFYNYKAERYELLEAPQYKKMFYHVIEEADRTIWSRRMEGEYVPCFIRKLSYATDNGMKPGKILFSNAILDYDKNEIYSPSSEHFCLMQLPYKFDLKATAPKFQKFLEDIFEGDQERIDLIQEIMGICLYYDDIMQKLVIFLGGGSNGKSLLANIIKKMVGEKNVSAIALDQLGGSRFAKQNLDYKLLNISSETKSEKLYSTSDLKFLTGGDSVEVEEKFQKSYTTEIHSKFILLANEMIQTKDYSDGFYRRLLIIPFNKRYHDLAPGQEPMDGVSYKDVDLEEKLMEELPGICNFALEGLDRYFDNNCNLTYSQACEDALEHYKNEHNVVKAFVNSCLLLHEPEEHVKTKRSLFFAAFKRFCAENHFVNTLSSIQFLRQLREINDTEFLGIEEKHLSSGDYLKNVSIRGV